MGAYAVEASVRAATSSNSRTFAMSSRGAMRPGASPTSLGPGFCFEIFWASAETAANEPNPASALRRLITVFFIGLPKVCLYQGSIDGSQSRPAGLRHRHDELTL